MKCALFGVANFTSGTKTITVDISSLNLSSADDYMIVTAGDATWYTSGSGDTPNIWISDKTSTSFTVKLQGYINNPRLSYQVITFK